MLKFKKLKGILLVIINIALFKCGASTESAKEGSNVHYTNNIFTNTYLLEGSAITPTSTTPTFVWNKVGTPYIVISVFKEHISVRNNQIANTSDIVWLWYSGLNNNLLDGSVTYNKGITLTGDSAPPLTAGSTYYWAIWAYDGNYNLKFSSPEYILTPTN